jgi:transposase
MTPKRGGRWRDHRPVLNGIVFRTRAGIPWRDLPERSGPWETVDKRFARWQTDGTWARIEATLGTQADGAGELDWNAQIDAGVIRAHQHAAGARNGGSRRSRQATSRRWDGHGWADHQAPYHLRRPGRNLVTRLTPGQDADTLRLIGLVDQVRVGRPGVLGGPASDGST